MTTINAELATGESTSGRPRAAVVSPGTLGIAATPARQDWPAGRYRWSQADGGRVPAASARLLGRQLAQPFTATAG